MSAWSFHSLRQNMKGVKWVIMDQDLTGPTDAVSPDRVSTCRTPRNTPMGRYILKESRGNWETDWTSLHSERMQYMVWVYSFALAITNCPEQKAVLVVSHTPTSWMRVVLLSCLCSNTFEEMGNRSAHVRTSTEISQLIPLYSSSQN